MLFNRHGNQSTIAMSGAGMVDVLTTKIVAWEKERGKEFTYDGVSFLTPSFLSLMVNSLVCY
jgi:hypothetical protein